MGKLYNKNVVHFSDSSTGVMSLYQAGDKNSKGNKPLIFIRGHAGRWTVNTKKILDNAPYNMKLVKQHEGFWYNDKIHFPLIAEYSYKDNMKKHLREYKKSELTTASFSEAIIEMLEKEDDTKDKTIVVKELDLSRSLNTNGITYSTPNLASSSNNNIGISMSVGADSKSVALNIDWNKFGEFSGASAWASTVESYQITGFNKKIKDAFIGELGHDVAGTTLFYLMSDGTVEYTPLFNLQGKVK